MRYETEVYINLPRGRVIELFDSFENLKKWQEGLVSFEHISGDPGQPGAKTRLLYDMGRRRMEMIETIIKRDLPDEFSGTYDASGVHNIVRNYFYDEGERTRWALDSEFQFRSFMRIMSLFIPGRRFREQTRSSMESFKRFAENAPPDVEPYDD
ncbi:MAG: SRPBCC family protein [Chloroflexota bacterium]|nr:SRPBCC family protein [Chloroflexota bacterium]